MGNESYLDRYERRGDAITPAPETTRLGDTRPNDWPDDDPAKCLGCGEKFGLTLDSAMRSRWDSRLCVDCHEEAMEMLDVPDCDDTPV